MKTSRSACFLVLASAWLAPTAWSGGGLPGGSAAPPTGGELKGALILDAERDDVRPTPRSGETAGMFAAPGAPG